MSADRVGPPAAALDDLTVLDLSDSVAGAWCSRLFADFGADVTIVEPPDGHPVRREAPFDREGASLPAAHVLANKSSLALDLQTGPGRELLRELLSGVDLVIESFPPGQLDAWGLSFKAIEEAAPGVVLVSVTPYGHSGAYARYPSNELTVSARSGWASINGIAGRPPLQPSAFQSSYCAGALAYAAALAAVHERESGRATHGGRGQHVDISEFEVMASTFAPAALRAQYGGAATPQKETMDVLSGPVPVRDGHFALTLSRAHFFRDAMSVLGLEDLAENEQLHEGWYRRQHRELWVDRVHGAMGGWGRRELFDELALRRVVAGPVFEMSELSANEHLEARAFWSRPANQPTAPRRSGAPFGLTATPWRLERGAPGVGQQSIEVLARSGITVERTRGALASGVVVAEPRLAAGGRR